MFERPTGPLPAISGVTVRDRSGLSGAQDGSGGRRRTEPRSAGRSKPWATYRAEVVHSPGRDI